RGSFEPSDLSYQADGKKASAPTAVSQFARLERKSASSCARWIAEGGCPHVSIPQTETPPALRPGFGDLGQDFLLFFLLRRATQVILGQPVTQESESIFGRIDKFE